VANIPEKYVWNIDVSQQESRKSLVVRRIQRSKVNNDGKSQPFKTWIRFEGLQRNEMCDRSSRGNKNSAMSRVCGLSFYTCSNEPRYCRFEGTRAKKRKCYSQTFLRCLKLGFRFSLLLLKGMIFFKALPLSSQYSHVKRDV